MINNDVVERLQALYDELFTLDACAIAEGIQKRRFSSLEVIEAYLKRIEKLNPDYKAIVTLNDEALDKAREADLALSEGTIWGPLHGVPITIKDAIETKGLRTTVGHKKFENYVPEIDAECVRMLKSAGAIILAKTNCGTLCCDVQTSNTIFGNTSNPCNVNRTSGGSSGGEAVAIALGLSAVGIGSDTAGSIRIPASYCGIYGFKPTTQKISKQGLIPPLPGKLDLDTHLSTIGPMARSIDDLKLVFSILTGEKITGIKTQDKIKVAWTTDFPQIALDDEIKTQIKKVTDKLENNGINIEKIPTPFDLKKTVMKAIALNLFEFYPKIYNPLMYGLFWIITFIQGSFKGGTFSIYKSILKYREDVIHQLDEILNQFDCWVLPVTSTTAFEHNRMKSSIPVMHDGKVKKVNYLMATISFTSPFNFSGHPSVVIPIGKDKQGLPIAMQLIGQRGKDMDLLNIASVIDKTFKDN
jgi:amidase